MKKIILTFVIMMMMCSGAYALKKPCSQPGCDDHDGDFTFNDDLIIANDSKIAMTHTPLASGASGTIQVAPWDIVEDGTVNFGPNTTTRWGINIAQHHRMRDTQPCDKVEVFIKDKTNVTSFKVWIWRLDGATYDFVGESENILSSLVADSATTVDIADIAGCTRADYTGFEIVCSGDCSGSLRTHADTASDVYYVDTTEPTAADYDWTAKTQQANVSIPIGIYVATAPQVECIGDSLASGATEHYSFADDGGTTTDVDVPICNQFADLTGYTYQNIGVSAETTTNIEARFDTGCSTVPCAIDLNPRLIILNGGTNDIKNNDTLLTFYTKWKSMLDASDTASIPVIALGIFPRTSFTDDESKQAIYWNYNLQDLVSGYDNARYVDVAAYVGKTVATGAFDTGNLWDISTSPNYDDDSTHLNEAGYGVVAQAVLDAMDSFIVREDGGTKPVLVANEGAEGVGIGTYPASSKSSGGVTYGEGLSVKGKLTAGGLLITGDISQANVDGAGTYSELPLKTKSYVMDLVDDTDGNCDATDCLTLPQVSTRGTITITTDTGDQSEFVVDESGFIRYSKLPASTVDSGGLLLNNPCFNRICSDHIRIPTSDVITLQGTPYTLLSAPGAGSFVTLTNAMIQYAYSTTAFTVGADEDLMIEYSSGTDITASIETTGFIDQASAQLRYYPAVLGAGAGDDFTAETNKSIRLINTGAGELSDGGASYLEIAISYFTGGYGISNVPATGRIIRTTSCTGSTNDRICVYDGGTVGKILNDTGGTVRVQVQIKYD